MFPVTSSVYDGDDVLMPILELLVPKRIVVLALAPILLFPFDINVPVTSALPPICRLEVILAFPVTSNVYDGDVVLIPILELLVPKRIVVLALAPILLFPFDINVPVTSVFPPICRLDVILAFPVTSNVYDGDEVLIPIFELLVPKRIVVLAFALISEFPKVFN